MRNDVFITYRHLRRDPSRSDQGGVTFAIWVDLRDPEYRYMKFGWSACSKNDDFCKAVGRELAYADLNVNRRFSTVEIPVLLKRVGGTLVEQILDFIAENPSTYLELNRFLKRHVF